MSRPQVLVFIDWYAPGFNAGGPVRSLVNLVDHLRDRVDLHIVTSDTDYMEHVPYRGIEADRWTQLPGGERVWYASAAGINAGTWRRLLEERKWDVVYINGIYSRWFSIMPLWLLRGSRQRRVVAVRGMLASGMMKHGGLKKRLFLLAMRLAGCYKGVEFQATNTEEQGDITKWLSPNSPVHLVPNLARMQNAGSAPARSKSAGELRLLSVARIAVEKNTLFAIERLRGTQGQVMLDLYGSIYDEAYWRKCQEAIAALQSNISVTHKGVVATEEVPALFGQYHALFMPSQGENFGHTMAEALATGLPLVISDRTPWRGLEAAKAGWDLALDRPGDFHRAVQELVHMDQAQYDVLATGAFAMGKRYLNDPTPVQQSLSLFTR
jgi:glycosyltransferase involved in cell wall biosynthesis